MLSLLKRRSKTDGITSVYLEPAGFSLAHATRDATDSPRLEFCMYGDCSGPSQVARALAAAVRENGLVGTRCVGLLRPELYSLRQIDAPPVEADEMREAARWSVKDLIDFPAEDAAIDVFGVPSGGPAREKRIYVVATPSAVVKDAVDLIESSGLWPTAIDITELALRNVAALLPEDQRGVALMFLSAGAGVLTITHRGSLYLARRLHSELELLAESVAYESGEAKPDLSEEAEQILKSLLLETQRSIDYYEHQLEQGPVSALVLVPLEIPVSGLRRYLATHLSVDVSVLELNGVLKSNQSLTPALQARCLTAIGAALRRECDAA